LTHPIGDGEIGDLGSVRALVDRGDHLRAYDLATTLLSVDNAPRRPSRQVQAELEYLRVLALARSGSTAGAEAEIGGWDPTATGLPLRLVEDRAALRARLAKDRALLRRPWDQAELALAAGAYEAIYRDLASTYACANAATLWLLAAQPQRARELAQHVPDPAPSADADELTTYWSHVTAAEAALVLGEFSRARSLVRSAGSVARDNLGARAATRRQLRVLLEHLGFAAEAELRPLANPAVLHYCGHRVSAAQAERFRLDSEPLIEAELDRLTRQAGLHSGHGSLACGADLLIARSLLARGIEVHAVIPFGLEEFVDVSVRSGGAEWVSDFEFCLEHATSVTVTCDSAYLGDDQLFAFASQVAMGEALNRARSLDSPAIQLAVWDGIRTDRIGGTAHDIDTWRRAGGATSVIPAVAPRNSTADEPRGDNVDRPITAVLFGDIQGISRLRDEQLMAFLPAAWQAVAEVVDEYGDLVLDRNTWGDAIFLAFSSVGAAAGCALAIQEVFHRLDPVELGVPHDLHLRLAGHVGPVITLRDPLRVSKGHFGRELTRAARIEPRTPPGSVYVTRAFAALLELDPDAGCLAEYVGTVTTAREFETVPMFRLHDRNVRPSERAGP
jgi:adenylate cyclase